MKTLVLLLILIVPGLNPGNALVAQYRVTGGKEAIPAGTTPERRWWNLLYYDINIMPDYRAKFISGTNNIKFRALQTGSVMQIDLQNPMRITGVFCRNKSLPCTPHDNGYLIHLPKDLLAGEMETISIHFEGHPQVANRPPWESGWIWTTDKKGRPWMSIACEGSGASVWLPCKNVLYDEPDSGMSMSITVPDSLVAVANGRLIKKKDNTNGTATYTWAVINPINNYNIIPYIGKYVMWQEKYPGIKGALDCSYWVLDYNLDKARVHLQQTDTMLRCFEYWLGPYPFYEDGYKLVEAPMPGMEHQSAIAYGNGFENGYGGKDLSGTGWGLQWDFIMVHESGHEWFGNSITAHTGSDTWIHEGFTKYLETIYTGYVYGVEAGNDYAIGICKRILNDAPVIGSGSSDEYNKGNAMLHMIRQLIGDSTFKGMLQGLSKTFYHQTVSSVQVFHFINKYTGKDFTKIFDQYLKTTEVPVLEYAFHNNVFQYRWKNCVEGFDMPVKVSFGNNKYQFIYPTVQWQRLPVHNDAPDNFLTDRNFYIRVKNGSD